jgi:hypothetical protein
MFSGKECYNCKHADVRLESPPCADCVKPPKTPEDDTMTNWKPREGK